MSLTDMVIMPGGDYQAACDAIREKTGGTEPIKSGDMAAQIRGIVGQDTTVEDFLVSGATSGSLPSTGIYSNDRITQVRPYAFGSLPGLLHADLPNVVTVKNAAFTNSGFQTIALPSCMAVEAGAFNGSASLKKADIGRNDLTTPNIGMGTFAMCMALDTLILRGKTVSTLAGTVAFMETPIARGTGYIYVPFDLLAEYKSATNWSTYKTNFEPLKHTRIFADKEEKPMIQTEYLQDGSLIRHYSDEGMKLLQVETGIEYDDAVDVVPCRYTYAETEKPVSEWYKAEEADYLAALARLGVE